MPIASIATVASFIIQMAPYLAQAGEAVAHLVNFIRASFAAKDAEALVTLLNGTIAEVQATNAQVQAAPVP